MGSNLHLNLTAERRRVRDPPRCVADGQLWVETGLYCNESAVRCHPDVLCQIETQRKRTVSSRMSDGSPASPRAETLTGLVERVTYTGCRMVPASVRPTAAASWN